MQRSSTMEKEKKSGGMGWLSTLVVVVAAAIGYSYATNGYILEIQAWTAFSLAVATGYWDPCFFNNEFISSLFVKVHKARLGENPGKLAPGKVRELAAEDYSWEALRVASDNWMEPVIVRGLYADSPAVKKWPSEGGLNTLANFNVSVVQNSTRGKDHWINCGGHPGKDTIMTRFKDAYDEVVAYDSSSSFVSKTLVIPPASRSDRVRDPALDKALSELVDEDLDLPKIGGSWWKGVRNSALLQLWVGAGDDAATQGTGMHCDICNNFVIQLAGEKLWDFVHPKYSILMRPTMRRGKTAISGADWSSKIETTPFIPRMEATLRPGDFMYNPDWYWHSVRNKPGFTMAVVARECNVTNFFRGNAVFSGLILTNHLAAGFLEGDDYARTRLYAAMGLLSTMGDHSKSRTPGEKEAKAARIAAEKEAEAARIAAEKEAEAARIAAEKEAARIASEGR